MLVPLQSLEAIQSTFQAIEDRVIRLLVCQKSPLSHLGWSGGLYRPLTESSPLPDEPEQIGWRPPPLLAFIEQT